MNARRERNRPRVPISLPVVEIQMNHDDELTITVDKKPYETGATARGRAAVRDIVRDLADRLGPIRVELTEADGTTFTDIAVPTAASDPQSESSGPASPTANGHFQPGEEVMIVVVVGRRTANPEGRAPFRLPPALLVRDRVDVRLVGSTSGTVAAYDTLPEAVAP